MKNFKQKFVGIFAIAFAMTPTNAQITPDMFVQPGNTGSNMTIMIQAQSGTVLADKLADFVGGQIGAFYDLNGNGYIDFGTPYTSWNGNTYYPGHECVGLETIIPGFFGLALWGDDSSTNDKDGLSAGDSPEFAILHNGNVILVNEIPQFSGYVTNGITNLTGATLSRYQTGCEDPNACNTSVYQDVEFLGGSNCTYPEPWFDCDGVCLDLNNNSICDIDETPGCTDPLYVNYDPNAGFDDGSCSETWEEVNSSLSSEIEALSSELSDVSYQLDTMTSAYLTLLESPQCEEIIIDIEEGWNIFGYTSAQILDIAEVMAPYQDKIYIIKDNNGAQYWPAVDFNGIGDFTPGGGYQIKAYEPFSISFEN